MLSLLADAGHRSKFKKECIKMVISLSTTKKIVVILLLLVALVLIHNLSFIVGHRRNAATSAFPNVRVPRCPSSEHTPRTTQNQGYVQRLPTPRIESKLFDYSINTRRIVLLATQRMNQIVHQAVRKLTTQTSCAKWWANPLDVRRNVIVNSTTLYDDHRLEFVAVSNWEITTFRTKVRMFVHQRPEGVEFLNDEFVRVPDENATSPRQACFQDENGLGAWVQLCSCGQGSPAIIIEDGGLSAKAWPVNASFLLGDYLNFGDASNFFNIVPPLPAYSPLNLVVVIVSAPLHFAERYAIRTTFGAKSELGARNASLFFLMGRVQDQNVQHLISEEASIYQDIIQPNLVDAYQNLTLKHLSILAYVYFSFSEPERGVSAGSPSHCETRMNPFERTSYNPPPYLLKADDDFFLNLDLALMVSAANPEVELMGSLNCGGSPFRNIDSKYYVPSYIYSGDKYPPFLLGGTILLKTDVIPRFLQASLTVPMMNIGDPYVTGLLCKALGILPRNSSLFGTHYTGKEKEKLKRYYQLRTMVHSHMDSVEEFQETWDMFSSPPPPPSKSKNGTVLSIAAPVANFGTSTCPR